MNLVQKYGGDYLKDASDLTAIADYVTRSRKEGDQLILVVAALQEIAKPMTERMNEMGLGEEISKGKLDLLFSTAEQQTALLLAAALEKNGLPAWAIDSIRGESLTNIEKD